MQDNSEAVLTCSSKEEGVCTIDLKFFRHTQGCALEVSGCHMQLTLAFG